MAKTYAWAPGKRFRQVAPRPSPVPWELVALAVLLCCGLVLYTGTLTRVLLVVALVATAFLIAWEGARRSKTPGHLSALAEWEGLQRTPLPAAFDSLEEALDLMGWYLEMVVPPNGPEQEQKTSRDYPAVSLCLPDGSATAVCLQFPTTGKGYHVPYSDLMTKAQALAAHLGHADWPAWSTPAGGSVEITVSEYGKGGNLYD